MIVIPMAGQSRRFQLAGYNRAKYMLTLRGRTLFAHAVGSFSAYFESEPFLFIVRDGAEVASFMEGEIRRLGIKRAATIVLPGPTLGQADTVRLGLAQAAVGEDEPLTVFNVDTFRPRFRYPTERWMGSADGYLEVMIGSDPGLSFVEAARDGDGRVVRTAEKEVISDLASTGLYWFKRSSDFCDAMASAGTTTLQAGEIYVAPLYNALIARGLDIRYHVVSAKDVILSGIPEQYRALGGLDP